MQNPISILFNYVVGKLTVTKAPLVISAGNYTKKQGDAMPLFKASYSGFKMVRMRQS